MKYTRYDMKRKKSNNMVFGATLLLTLIFALIIGTLVSKIVFKESPIGEGTVKSPVNTEQSEKAVDAAKNNNESKKNVKYIAIQGGMFSKSEGVEQTKTKLSDFGNPFTIAEEKGTRVILGVYKEEEALNIMKTLSDKGVANSKVSFEVNLANKEACDELITGMINAELDVLLKLTDKQTKSYKTNDLKAWCEENSKNVNEKSKNISILNEVKAHINSLPAELGKDKANECYAFIYNTLKKLTGK